MPPFDQTPSYPTEPVVPTVQADGAPAPADPAIAAANKKAGGILKDWIENAKKTRKRFMEQFYELSRYAWAENHNFNYENVPNYFKAKVGLTGEAVKVFGPLLYQQNPNRQVTPREWATPEQKARAALMAETLNFTPKKHKLADESRAGIDEYIVSGRGVVWTGLDEGTGLARTMFDTVENLLVDPNAKRWQDVKVVGRRRCMTRFEAVALYPAAKDVIAKLPANALRASDSGAKALAGWNQQDPDSDCIYFYEIYTLVGLQQFKGGVEWLKLSSQTQGQPMSAGAEFDAPNAPKKWVVGEDGTYLTCSDWEAPFHKNTVDPWPCSVLDFKQHPKDIWTASLLGDAIGYQRAINWILTLLLGKVKVTSRTVLASLKQNGQGLTPKQKDRVLVGTDIEMIEIEVKGDKAKLGDYLQQLNWDSGYIQPLMELMDQLEDKFRMATGLYSVLYSGQGDTQDRSAAATQMKDRNSRSRVEDMRDQIANWQGIIAMKEALVTRFLVGRETIAKYLGPQAAEQWGFLVPPEAAGPTYWFKYLVEQGVDAQSAAQQAEQLAAQAAPISEILDSDFSIEVSSIRRRDVDQQIDVLTEMNNQVNPSLLASPDPNDKVIAFENMAALFKVQGAPDDLVQAYRDRIQQLKMPPPMPPMGPPPGVPPSAPTPPPQGP